MPQMIHPEASGTVNISMTTQEARTLADALEGILEYIVPETNMPMARTPQGITCAQFIGPLRRIVGYERL